MWAQSTGTQSVGVQNTGAQSMRAQSMVRKLFGRKVWGAKYGMQSGYNRAALEYTYHNEGSDIFDAGTLIMIPAPLSGSHDRRVVEKKSLLNVRTACEC